MPAWIFARQSQKKNVPHLCRWKWKTIWMNKVWINFALFLFDSAADIRSQKWNYYRLPLYSWENLHCWLKTTKSSCLFESASIGNIHIIVIVRSIALRKISFRCNHNAKTPQGKFFNVWIYMTFIICSNFFLFSVSRLVGSVRYIITWWRKGAKENTGRQRLFSGRTKNDTHFSSVKLQQSTDSIDFLMTKSYFFWAK